MGQQEAAPIRRRARELYCKGELAAALEAQRTVVEATRAAPHPGDTMFLGILHFVAGDFQAAREVMHQGYLQWPEQTDFMKNIGVCYSRQGHWEEAIDWLNRAIEADPTDPNLHDGLARVFGELGDMGRARAHGEKSLTLKDAWAARQRPAATLDGVPVPPFREDAPRRNVIAFSLWGAGERYTQGAIENARIAAQLYPAWRCRFYCDATVPAATRAELLAAGADVVLMPEASRLFGGLFWRFLVANDPQVERYLVRDADSLLNLRERLAVDEWLESGEHFHVMRDFFSHTDPMLAGLWGGVRGALPALPPLFAPYLDDPTKTANCDQRFLREKVWPIARQSCCVHDSLYRVLGARPFPANARLPADQHVGQNAAVHAFQGLGAFTSHVKRGPRIARRARFVAAIAATEAEAAYLARLLAANLPAAEVHHRRDGPEDLTPDARQVGLFNSRGNAGVLRDFWRRKLARDLFGAEPVYVETSPLLVLAGLMENLALLGPATPVEVVVLERAPVDVYRELMAQSGSNGGFGAGLPLGPDAPRRIVDPAPLHGHGLPGACLWYAAETAARAAYYRLLLKGQPNLRFHRIDLATLATTGGAVSLLAGLGVTLAAGSVKLPEPTTAAPVEEDRVDEIRALVRKFPFDSAALAGNYFEAGRRLGALA